VRFGPSAWAMGEGCRAVAPTLMSCQVKFLAHEVVAAVKDQLLFNEERRISPCATGRER